MAVALPFLLGGLSALGSLADSNQQIAQQQGEANAADMNAAASRNDAATAQQQAGVEEEAKRRDNRAFLAEQGVQLAQAGIGTTSSTAQSLAVQSSRVAEQDALNIRYGGLLQAHGYNVRAQQYDYAAKTARSQAKSLKASRWLKAGTAGLQGYASGGGSFGGGSAGGASVSAASSGSSSSAMSSKWGMP